MNEQALHDAIAESLRTSGNTPGAVRASGLASTSHDRATEDVIRTSSMEYNNMNSGIYGSMNASSSASAMSPIDRQISRSRSNDSAHKRSQSPQIQSSALQQPSPPWMTGYGGRQQSQNQPQPNRAAPQINTEHISVGQGRYSFPATFAPNLASRSADTTVMNGGQRQGELETDDRSLSTLSHTIDQSCSYVNRGPRGVSTLSFIFRYLCKVLLKFFIVNRAWLLIALQNSARR